MSGHLSASASPHPTGMELFHLELENETKVYGLNKRKLKRALPLSFTAGFSGNAFSLRNFREMEEVKRI
jgi:hypothetical protein